EIRRARVAADVEVCELAARQIDAGITATVQCFGVPAIAHRLPEGARPGVQHEPQNIFGVALQLDEVISATERSDLPIRAFARRAQDRVVLTAVGPPFTERDAVLTRMEAPLLRVATTRLTDGNATVDAVERTTHPLRRRVCRAERRLRGDHAA